MRNATVVFSCSSLPIAVNFVHGCFSVVCVVIWTVIEAWLVLIQLNSFRVYQSSVLLLCILLLFFCVCCWVTYIHLIVLLNCDLWDNPWAICVVDLELHEGLFQQLSETIDEDITSLVRYCFLEHYYMHHTQCMPKIVSMKLLLTSQSLTARYQATRSFC